MSSPEPDSSPPATPQGPQPSPLLNYQPAPTPDTVTPTRPLDWRYPTWILAVQLAISTALVLRHTYHPDAYYFGGISIFIAIVAIVGITYFPLYGIHLVLRAALRNIIHDSYWHYLRLSRVLLILAALSVIFIFSLPLRFSFLPFISQFNQLARTYRHDPTNPIEPYILTVPLPGGPMFIGPYKVTDVRNFNGGVILFLDNGGSGFAYIPNGSPGSRFNTDADGYLGGGWWYFIEG